MQNNYVISKMSFAEVQLAISWADKEGWNPGLNDAVCFYAADPDGFFAGRLNGEIIAVGSAVVYDDNFAFCGLYIVKPEYRGHNYGVLLGKAMLDYMGERTIGIDGVLNMTNKYERLGGYKTAYKHIRYKLNTFSKPVIHSNPQIVYLNSTNFQQLIDYDRLYFPAPRIAFLDVWINQSNAIALAFIQDGIFYGYGVVRTCGIGAKIGPLFAETPEIANSLFMALCNTSNTLPIFLDVPEPNVAALKLVDNYKMQEVFATYRMYRNGTPEYNAKNTYGVTTFELG